MDLDSMRQLKLDVRMLRRRGWISADALEKELAQLPDVAAKAAPADVPASDDNG